ncbi:MAG TPA: PilZ domain-containing protein [Desulfobacterales bacterium]|nr:PilZ domain-containing protein [Desulfobacterales bacterium]
MNDNTTTERRESTRFLVEGNAIAVLGPLSEGLGQVIELSLSGFSFLYDGKEEVPAKMERDLTFFGFETICLGLVPMTTVSDQPVREDGATTVRRLGIRFDTLTPEQRAQLKRFIYDNAYIEVSDEG